MELLLINLVWTLALGLAVGNYATSFVFRMPEKQAPSPFTKHPFCGGCGTMLQTKDLFPAVSWLLLGGKCRYCDMEIPAVYFWVELLCAFIFMAGVVSLGWSEEYLLVVVAGTVVITLWALEVRTQRIYYSLLLLIASAGFIYRTLLDGTLYDALFGMVWGAMVPLFVWRIREGKANPNGEKEPMQMPPSAALWATAGAWLAPFGLLVFIGLWVLYWLAYRTLASFVGTWPKQLATAPFGLALMTLILWPDILTVFAEQGTLMLRSMVQ